MFFCTTLGLNLIKSVEQFQRRSYAKLSWFQSGKKGYGLQLQEDVSEGRFLIEYVGEVPVQTAYYSFFPPFCSWWWFHGTCWRRVLWCTGGTFPRERVFGVADTMFVLIPHRRFFAPFSHENLILVKTKKEQKGE